MFGRVGGANSPSLGVLLFTIPTVYRIFEKENTFKMDTDLAKALKDMDSTAINDSSTLNAVNEFIEKWSTLEKDD